MWKRSGDVQRFTDNLAFSLTYSQQKRSGETKQRLHTLTAGGAHIDAESFAAPREGESYAEEQVISQLTACLDCKTLQNTTVLPASGPHFKTCQGLVFEGDLPVHTLCIPAPTRLTQYARHQQKAAG